MRLKIMIFKKNIPKQKMKKMQLKMKSEFYKIELLS